MLSSLIEHVKKYKERAALTGMGIGLIVLIGMGLYLQKFNSSDKTKVPIKDTNKVELDVKKTKSTESSFTKNNKSTFYLRPSAEELLQQLAEMETLQEDVAQKKFENLRVLWRVYFFSLDTSGDVATILLDISEDGFGAIVAGTVKAEDYPELISKQPGDRLWVAGEIVGVDPSGTGTIHLDISLLDFTAKGPQPAQEESGENSKPIETPQPEPGS